MSKVILGGGISGLSTAFFLSKKCNNGIVLYEASDRLGGYIRTRTNESGSYFEQGARTLRFSGLAAESTFEVLEEIGLSAFIRPAGKSLKNRYFYVNNKLCSLPNSWTSLFRRNVLFNEPLLFPLVREVFGSRKKVNDESVYDFIFRRFGKGYADVLSAVICGIYAGNAGEISVKSAMRILFEKEQKYGSVLLGLLCDSIVPSKDKNKLQGKPNNRNRRLTGVWSLDGGMETLPSKLGGYLTEKGITDIRLSSKCNRIEFKGDHVVLDIDGKTEVAEHLYSSLPSKDLCKLLGNDHCFLRDELSKIPFVSVAVVNVEYNGNVLPVEGFGLLVPPNQKLPILGIIFDSCIYPQENKTVLTVMMGGSWFEEYFGPNPEEKQLLKVATDHIRMILSVDGKPAHYQVSILRDCIPQYVIGHSERVEQIKNYISQNKLPLTLIGNSYNGVGIPDAILSARMGVELQSNR